MACMVESSQPPAVLTFSAPVREARSALLPLLQPQSASAMAHVADARAFAMRAFLIVFRHVLDLSFSWRPARHPGSRDNNNCFDFPVAREE